MFPGLGFGWFRDSVSDLLRLELWIEHESCPEESDEFASDRHGRLLRWFAPVQDQVPIAPAQALLRPVCPVPGA